MPASAGLIREAGGLGDVIRMGVVAQALKRRGIDHVTAYGLGQFQTAFEHLAGIDAFVPVPVSMSERRTRTTPWHAVPYLRSVIQRHDKIADLFCPGFTYETTVQGRVSLNRSELFCAAAGIQLDEHDEPRPRWIVRDDERAYAQECMAGGPIVGIALGATDPARTLPNPHAAELVGRLTAEGYRIWVIDNQVRMPPLAVERWLVKADIHIVAAVIQQLHALIAVDSGPLHLAGALDVPTVGLFGPTDPVVMLKHYPRARGLTGYGWDGSVWSPCRSPCWFRPERGWNPPSCRGSGCWWMHRLSMREAIECLRELAPRSAA